MTIQFTSLAPLASTLEAFARFLGVLSDDCGSHMWWADVRDAADWHAEAVTL